MLIAGAHSDTHRVNNPADCSPPIFKSNARCGHNIGGRFRCRVDRRARSTIRHQQFASNNPQHKRVREPTAERIAISKASSTIHSLQHLFQSIIFAIICATVASEDDASTYDDDAEADVIIMEQSSPACVAAFSLMFGFFITLFCAVIGYFAFVEDSLMRTYIKEGDLIKGDVMSAEFARGGGQVGACSNKRAIAEYIAFVEYTRELSTNYEVRIRKQMKIKETDFLRPLVPGSSAMLKSLKDQVEGDKIFEGGDPQDIDCDGYIDIGPARQTSELGRPDTIELYVLPDFPAGALSRRQVERSCSCRHRLATFALIVVVLALAAFCTRIAAEALVDMIDSEEERLELYAILLFVALVVAQVPLVHFSMRGLFWNVIREEYLESGEYVTIHRDDSTLSTTASDIFLMSPCASSSVGLDITTY